MSNPDISVILPVFNEEKYINEAIESILNQSHKNFEFIIINDGSTDRTKEIIEKYCLVDSRIVLVNQSNKGLVASLNRALSLSKGTYIARMDHDDISMPARLKLQFQYMETHPEIGICGTWIERFGDSRGLVRYHLKHEQIIIDMFFGACPIVHPTVMFRRKILIDNNLKYDPEYETQEDFDMWVRCSRFTKLCNLNKILLKYRSSVNQMSKKARYLKAESFFKLQRCIMQRQIRLLEIEPALQDLSLHLSLYGTPIEGIDYLKEVENWLKQLQIGNEKVKIYHRTLFNIAVSESWYKACIKEFGRGINAFKAYWNSPLTSVSDLGIRLVFWQAIKCIIPSASGRIKKRIL